MLGMPPKTARKKRGASKARRRPARKKAAAKKPAKSKAKLAPPTIPDRSLEVVWRPVAKLRPSRNARTHSDAQVQLIAGSLQEFGWMNPPLVDVKGSILAGHGRWQAAKLLGLRDMPTIPVEGLTARQKRSYILADNRLAELAGWDIEILAGELGTLKGMGMDLGILGWDPDQVRETLAAAGATLRGKTQPDDVPEPLEQTTSLEGDIWALGQHRLLCGDCTKPMDVTKLLDSRRAPNLMVTDPPYGVEYDPSWRVRHGLAGPGKGGAKGKVANDDRSDWREAWELFPGNVVYVWHAGTKCDVVSASLLAAGFIPRSQIVWIKPRFAISRGAYHVQHEPAWFAVKEGATEDGFQEREEQPDAASGLDPFDRFEQDHDLAAYAVRKGQGAGFRGGRKQSTLWHIDYQKSATTHPTEKPVAAMQRPIENHSAAGDAVYEPFCGSGTTIVAAEMSGRICYAIELTTQNVDMAIRRWQDFTGKEALLESSGATWSEVTEERGGG